MNRRADRRILHCRSILRCRVQRVFAANTIRVGKHHPPGNIPTAGIAVVAEAWGSTGVRTTVVAAVRSTVLPA